MTGKTSIEHSDDHLTVKLPVAIDQLSSICAYAERVVKGSGKMVFTGRDGGLYFYRLPEKT